ncbi:MAG: FtsX-like permease family protein [Pedosphaera sp.]|nr:FtsX-like permease family protein [Pedosphaera sp.]
MIWREIAFRKFNFVLALLSVSAAVACLIGTLTLLRTDKAEVAKAGAGLEDAIRKITKGLGFNVIILPEDQDLNEMHLEGSLNKQMPEEYAHRLAESKIVTINHLLPTIMKKLTWPETGLPIVLYGTRGEVPIQHRDPKKPLLDTVPKGTMIIGHHVSQKLGLKEGDETTLLGHKFFLGKVHGERGNIDDATVWINLTEAQELLGMQNLIHAIQALECHCAGDRISQIRVEIARILPGTQVLERGPPALARAEARDQARQSAEDASKRREAFAAVLAPLIWVGAAVWIGFLMLGNVRERRAEIGILRAIGFRSSQILLLFLGKAFLFGILGTLLGFVVGALAGASLGEMTAGWESLQNPEVPIHFVLALGLAVALSVFASWIPALSAARQDPALVLQEE